MSIAESNTVAALSFWRILWGIIRKPRRTFEYLRDRPHRAWLWMAALALLASLLPVLASAPISTRIAKEAMQQNLENIREQNPGMTPEQEAQMLGFAANPLFTTIIPGVGAVVFALLGWLIWSGAIHLLSTMMGGGETFGQIWRVVIWSQVPFVLRNLLQGVYITLSGELISNPGLSGLVGPERSAEEALQQFMSAPPSTGQLALQSVLGKIDLFMIWNLVLLTIGVAVTARLSGRKAALIVLLVWGVLTLLGLVPILISGSMASQAAF